MKNVSSFLEQTISPLVLEENWSQIDLIVNELYESTGIRISLILPDGRVIAETLKGFQDMESHQNRPEIRNAFTGEESHTIRYSSTTREDMLFFAYPIYNNEQVLLVSRLGIFLEEMNDLQTIWRNIIILITIILLFLGFMAAYYVSRKINLPFLELKEVFDRVIQGDMDARIMLTKGKYEFNEITELFNQMMEKIKESRKTILSETAELHSILSTIPNGIALLDRKGQIVLSNEYFKEYFALSKEKEKYYWEVIRDNALNEKINLLLNRKQGNFIKETSVLNKDLLCKGKYIDKNQQLIMVFQDITRSKRLDKEKKELIANISHELRTPLTSIKGYLETLSEVDEESKTKYIKIISRNTDRLTNLVNDLLLLSKIEEQAGKTGKEIEREMVNLKEIIENLHKIFEPVMKEKNLLLKVNIEKNLPDVEADAFQIEQLLINILDNAIHYTDRGEIKISARSGSENRVLIEIEDTGIGIKKEELSRIFERFYVVNKSRSRQQGGTGLGLAIVKHIVLLHKGEIKVDSQPGVGTRMSIILPVKQS